jgi:hypothetical protein
VVTDLPKREDGLLAVPVLEGPVVLSVDWTTTPDVMAGRWISGISALIVLALAGLWAYQRHANRQRRVGSQLK